MTISLPPRPGNGNAVAEARPPASPACYSLYGLRVWSQLLLPAAICTTAAPDGAAWVLARSEPVPLAPVPSGTPVAAVRCYEPCHQGAIATSVYRPTPEVTVVAHHGAAQWSIDLSRRRVDLVPQIGIDDAALGLMFSGQVAVLLLQRLGVPCLHASAVEVNGCAAAFLGPKGQGKSSMAAHFLGAGAALLADDALALKIAGDDVFATPSMASMKLWGDTAGHTLGLGDELPDLAPGLPKKFLQLGDRYSFATGPVPLRRIFLLDRYEPEEDGRLHCEIQELKGRESIAAFLTHTAGLQLLGPPDMAAWLPIYGQLASRLPLRLLRYPSGYEYQAEVRARILADLEV